jgi:hypothetical protein
MDLPDRRPESPPTPALLRSLAANPTVMADLIGALHRRVRDATSLVDLMGRAAREAVRLLPGVHWAGVTAQFGGLPFTGTATDPRVLTVDESQYSLDDGPCLRALRADSPVSMTVAEVTASWPVLGAAASEVGVRSFLAVPLHVDGEPFGSLNLYSAEPTADLVDQDVLTVLAEYLDRGLADFAHLHGKSATEAALRAAVAGWVVVDQAVAVLMNLHGFTADYAREVLSDQAEDWGRTVPEQAAEVIARNLPSGGGRG